MKKVILVILDGFGASAIEEGNAVLGAKTDFLDSCWQNYPKTLLSASGEEVGLNWGEMGNSEVGHLNLGTGRVTMHDLPRINFAIKDGSFFTNKNLLDACKWSNDHKSKLHLIGLLSSGGVHADVGHLKALLELAKKNNVKKVYLHLFTDGRDMPKKSAQKLFDEINDKINTLKIGKIATIIGRYFAMDRDNNWDRIEKAYSLITKGKGSVYSDYESVLKDNYTNAKDDENIEASIIDKKGLLEDNDSIIFFNFRSDRAKQLTEAFISPRFDKFNREKYARNVRFISFVSYGNEQTPLVDVAYIADSVDGQIAQLISNAGLRQFHIAETEKYAHVTHFFNGGVEKSYKLEDRIIVPSPKVLSYDKLPEMSAVRVTDEFIKFFKSKRPDFSIINYANPDMVGHTGNYKATKKAIEITDKCLLKIAKNINYDDVSMIITADHGNSEQMINLVTKDIDKQHTTNAVPFVVIDSIQELGKKISNKISYQEKMAFFGQNPTGVIADVSPTVLSLMGIKKSLKMTGMSLKDVI